MAESLNIVFAGTPEFAAVALAALLKSPHRVIAVYTQPDRPAGRGRKLTPSAVKSLALEHGIPVHQPLSLKEPGEQAKLAALKPDLMIVAAYGLLLPKAVLETPRLGCLNIHGSILPRWRGAAPIQRSILAGDPETGITIMQMDVGLDTGDMLHIVRTPITREDNAQTLHDRLAELGARALLEALDQLIAGTLPREKQDNALATYAKKLEKAEAELEWNLPALTLERQVRAFNPWPVSQTRLGEETLRVWAARAIDGSGAPGKVVRAGKEGIDVGTGDGLLRLTQIQLPGGKPLDAAAFLNAGRNLEGVILGNG
jgi:methionyl-tRNA formyltransferase